MITMTGALREEDYVIGKMSLEQENAIAAKNLILWDSFANFWREKISKGKTCFESLIGNIYSAAEKLEFEKQDKMLLSIPELIPKVNALEGMLQSSRREGIIVAEGEEDAPDTETASRILKSIHNETQFYRESTATFIDGMIAGYPTFMWFEKPTDWAQRKAFDIYHEAWDAVLPDPNYRMEDLSDCEELIRLKAVPKDRLKEMYPKREKIIEHRVREGRFSEDAFVGGATFTASERNTVLFHLSNSSDIFSRTGLVYVIERLHFVYKTGTVYVSEKEQGAKFLSPDWSPEEVQRWRALHPDYHPVQRRVRCLYVTASTNSGVLLENAPHWYQENEFPCEMFVPKTLDNQPYGMLEFLIGSLKMKNTARIEHLHSLRLANDNLIKVKEGAVKNAAELEMEKGRVGGTVVIDKDYEMSDVEFVVNRREQLGWKELSDDALEDLNRIFIDRNFEGGVQSSQESGKAIQARIAQNQVKQAPYINSYNYFDLRCNRKILKMLPHAVTEYHMFRYVDPQSGMASIIGVNEPQQFDWQTGAVTRLKNNLAGARYDYREAPGDNSITGKESELNAFIELARNVLPAIDMSSWPFILASVPNRLAQELGRKIDAALKAQAEKGPAPEPMKKTLSITGEDLLHNPMVQEILRNEGVLPGAAAPMAQAPGTPDAAAMMQPMAA